MKKASVKTKFGTGKDWGVPKKNPKRVKAAKKVWEKKWREMGKDLIQGKPKNTGQTATISYQEMYNEEKKNSSRLAEMVMGRDGHIKKLTERLNMLFDLIGEVLHARVK